jgi:glycogen(starch) synthase
MRIAFLTSEYVTDYQDGGGLGNYLHRMVKVLVDQGHEPEVFVSSALEPRVLNHAGVRVERVPPRPSSLAMRGLRRVCDAAGLRFPAKLFLQARALAAALERRHGEDPFGIVQSADYMVVGLRVRRMKRRVHVIRCSSAADLYNEIDGHRSRDDRWREKLERAAIRRADKAYAPSRFIAEHFRNRHGIPVEVLRPPVRLETAPSPETTCGLPQRFLIHFGQLGRRKGTYWLGESLKCACNVEPDLRMVWVGRDYEDELGKMLAPLGSHRWKVQVLHPLPKAELYAVLQRADAAVLPSLVDNLPNTVIECLMLGIPVIGTQGASIDELVQPGVTGELVAPDDVDGLAATMVRVWRGQSAVRKGFKWRGDIVDEMCPAQAVERFLQLASPH